MDAITTVFLLIILLAAVALAILIVDMEKARKGCKCKTLKERAEEIKKKRRKR